MRIPYAVEQPQRVRALSILALGEDAVSAVGANEYRVRSASGRGYYRIKKEPKRWSCECPSAVELFPANCKHVWAVRMKLLPGEYASVANLGKRDAARHRRHWPAYDAAQQAEHPEFDDYLWDLLRQVEEPTRGPNQPGRPAIPLRTQIFHTVKKVHLGQSSRRARGLISQTSSGLSGGLPSVPNYTVPSRFLNRPDACELLLNMVEFSALPLSELEDGGTVAIDATGFSTTTRGAYATEKYEPGRKHGWVKGHFVIGTRTHAILSVAVTDERGGDCPQFVPLIRRVVAAGFHPAAAVADRAYATREIYNELDRLGIEGWIPFRSNTTGQAKGSPLYHRKWLEFQLQRQNFDSKYHVRSNIESVNAALKAKLREGLLSKNPGARFAEVLAKVVAFNIGLLVYWSRDRGIDRVSVGTRPHLSRLFDPQNSVESEPRIEAGAESGEVS